MIIMLLLVQAWGEFCCCCCIDICFEITVFLCDHMYKVHL